MAEERKRDIEETADFIKSLLDSQKRDWSEQFLMLRNDTDEVKKNIIDRCSLQEVLSIKKDFQA